MADDPSAGARVPAKLAHFVIRTPHYEATVRWYETVLGARAVFSNPMVTFMTYDEEHHRVAVINFPGLPESPSPTAGVDHVAFTFAGLGDLLHTYRRLKAEGIMPYWSINHGPTTSLYYRDPNGIQVELQIDNFATIDEFHAFIRGGAFQRNPIGVEFDPDVLSERFEHGVPLAELIRQGSAPATR